MSTGGGCRRSSCQCETTATVDYPLPADAGARVSGRVRSVREQLGLASGISAILRVQRGDHEVSIRLTPSSWGPAEEYVSPERTGSQITLCRPSHAVTCRALRLLG